MDAALPMSLAASSAGMMAIGARGLDRLPRKVDCTDLSFIVTWFAPVALTLSMAPIRLAEAPPLR